MADLFGANASRLMSTPQPGVTCNAQGAYVGGVPLLKRQRDASGEDSWVPRPIPELNADLKEHYGLPIDLSGKADGLAYIAGALNRGDVFRAQLAMQQLRLPSVPTPTHSNDNTRTGLPPGVIPAQEFMELPWIEPWRIPGPIPRPQFPTPEAVPWRAPVPPTGAIPSDRDLPNGYRSKEDDNYGDVYDNPYPNDKECRREWAEAYDECIKQFKRRDLRIPPGGTFDETMSRCMRGMVSERCGGYPIDYGRTRA
jgi:hypothetical protein